MKIYTKAALNDFNQSLTYDDISLITTEVSRIRSRTDAVTSCRFLDLNLLLPVISSPMESVTGIEMAKALTDLGCLGILNRFDSSLKELLTNNNNGKKVRAISIALSSSLN
jgi:IMP dehydrogenase/GMP reductase